MILYDLKKGCEIKKIEHPLSLALGCFDGLHLGHAELIDTARRAGAYSGIFTFSSNPFGALHIMTLSDKLARLREMGVDYCAVCDFDEIRDMSAEDFVSEILIERLNVVHAVCGFNFRFGVKAHGDAVFLSDMMKASGRDCTIIDARTHGSQVISSSRIRNLLSNGEMEKAAELLGRNYSLIYNVSHGNGIGNILGFPTINTDYKKDMQPIAQGVYICRCLGRPAVTNFGVRPTVTVEDKKVYETFILDFEGDLYGENVQVEFLSMLRPEKKFESAEALCEQIARDVEATRNYFEINSL
ncbi:MAG: riboflavin biosynthesis protein RibF [Ruminococcaceae bacterium]|nr:riboflavin biosynthesis protein RibF [Oscillospiraceae bacterium]